ncbi:MAG TPA: BMP family ABC transporter substrate-binding protein, partial [Acidimicrobiia bacterium]|nr:BMP family ABC transporter substrate-binding protein [Acidimicrobiia bacterium]
MKFTGQKSAALLIVLTLVACGSPIAGVTTTSDTTSTTDAVGSTSTGPTATTTPPPGAGLLACQVSDFGGIEDQPINQVAWDGMERAATDFGVAIEFLRSNDESNYRRNIDAALAMGCDLVVTTGVLMAPDTAAAAAANPDGRFAILDHPVGGFDPWGSPP